jgi:CDP-diacylglycerol--serine O-phosphatidyltransferase
MDSSTPPAETQDNHKKTRRRGIYLLPNLFTTGALFAGFYAITSAMHQRYEAAAIAIFVAMIMDGLDGRIARLTNTQSAFGVEYDSLSDMLCFGVAPALVMYLFALSSMGKYGWAAAFIYVAAAALRLARFNTQVATADKAYFQGLPSPAAAALLAGLLWVAQVYEMSGEQLALVVWALTVSAALLMVSRVRFRSFKDLNVGRVPFFQVLIVVMLFVLIFVAPAQMLFGLFLLYAASGLVLTLVELRKRRAGRRGHSPN